MSRLASFLILCGLLSVGCAHKNPDPQQMMAPPPGWNAAPPQGAVVAPAPSGCSSCAGSNPVVNAPRYSPPTPAAPPLTSITPNVTPGVSLGNPVSGGLAMGPIQPVFKPTALPIERARFGAIQVDETPSIPVPPSDKTDEQKTDTATKS